MKQIIRLTESQIDNAMKRAMARFLNEDIYDAEEMDQYSEFNFEELAQHLKKDLATYGVVDASRFYDKDEIIIELPDEKYVYLIFEFYDDGSVRCVDVEMDVEDRAIIRITGTPIHERYFLGKGEEFDYGTLLDYIEKVINAYQKAKGMPTESIIRFVTESVKKKLNESEEIEYVADSIEGFDFNNVAKVLADAVEAAMVDFLGERGSDFIETELNFKDGTSIIASVDVDYTNNQTYSNSGDYNTPPESGGNTSLTIGQPEVSVYNADGSDWPKEEVEKLNIDWKPLFDMESENFVW